MGATSESSSSGGIFAACSGAEPVCGERGDGIDDSVSPGMMASVQIVTSRHRKVSLRCFRLGFMETSALDRSLE
jgi:hypothetical protein